MLHNPPQAVQTGEGRDIVMTRDERLVAFCREAIRIPSLSGKEEKVAALMKKTMRNTASTRCVR